MNQFAYILSLIPERLSLTNYLHILEALAILLTILLVYKKQYAIAQELLIGILVIVFIYTPATKLIKYEEYVLAMKAQPLLPALQTFLIYAVPFTEFLAVLLMAIARYRTKGLYISLGMLLLFTGYISLVQLNYYGRIPCSCGGVIRELSWNQHLLLNLFLISVTLTAIWTSHKLTNKEKKQKRYGLLAG